MKHIKCQCGQQVQYLSNMAVESDEESNRYIVGKCVCGLYMRAFIKNDEVISVSFFKL